MIRVTDSLDEAPETRAAYRLADLVRDELNSDQLTRSQVVIKPSLKIPKDPDVKDVDVMFVASFEPPLVRHVQVTFGYFNRVVRANVWSLAMCFEVKSHSDASKIRLNGRTTFVYTRDAWRNASEQSFKQAHATRQFLKSVVGRDFDVFVRNRLWLVAINSDELKAGQMIDELVFANTSFGAMVDRVIAEAVSERLKKLARKRAQELGDAEFDDSDYINESDLLQDQQINAIRSKSDKDIVQLICTALSTVYIPTALDRKRLERIADMSVDYDVLREVGKAQVIVRGFGGAGKTVVLLRSAVRQYHEGKRVLILTYNAALTSDLMRQLFLARISQGALDESIVPATLHRFFVQWLTALGIEASEAHEAPWFETCYEDALDRATQAIESGQVTNDDIRLAKTTYPNRFDFDSVYIDEAQDWLDRERTLLYKLYNPEQLLIAYGRDQLVRQDRPCDWDHNPDVLSKYLDLRRCLRLSPNLATFVSAYARQIGLEGWFLESDPALSGGRVLIMAQPFVTRQALCEELFRENKEAGNENVDMLFCVPYQGVQKDSTGRSRSEVGLWLTARGYSVYDAVDREERLVPPRTREDVRIVQYDSSRGLEGWITVLDGLDTFFENKMSEYMSHHGHDATSSPFLPEDGAHLFASRWSLIPLTRAISTIVITLANPRARVSKALLESAKFCKDFTDVRI